MRFLLDESAPLRLAGHLQSLGHDVQSIAQDYQTALDDPYVLQIAHRERRILITGDRDFGALIFRHQLPDAGVLYFRLHNRQLPAWIARLDAALRDHADDLAHQRFLVVAAGRHPRQDLGRFSQEVTTMEREEMRRRLFAPVSPEELARRQALVKVILAERTTRNIAPLTSEELVRQVREEEYRSYDDRR